MMAKLWTLKVLRNEDEIVTFFSLSIISNISIEHKMYLNMVLGKKYVRLDWVTRDGNMRADAMSRVPLAHLVYMREENDGIE